MEKIYTTFDTVYAHSIIGTKNTTINLTGAALAFLATGATISLIRILFAG